ncbi:hypothetical protein LCS82_09545 [Vibrio harveyi]|uniref:hypothetical protein n=1 Tax=Vibrio harveyi TaxID=669 RepID=UPI003BB541B0
MISKYELAEQTFNHYLAEYGDTIPNPNGVKPLKLTKQRFASMWGFDYWRDYRAFIETNETAAISEHAASLDKKIIKVLAPALIEFLSKDEMYVAEALKVYNELGLLNDADFEHFSKRHYAELPISLKNFLMKLFTECDPSKCFKLRLQDCHFIATNLWDTLTLETKLAVFHRLNISDHTLPYQQQSELWNTCYAWLSDRSERPYWDNFYGAKTESIRRLIAVAVKSHFITIEQLLAIYHDVNSAHERDGYSWRDGLFGRQDGDKSLCDAVLWLFSGDELNDADKSALAFYERNCLPANLSSSSDSCESIIPLLRSKSNLAGPVLATYMLYNFGSAGFQIDTLYAIFYYLRRYPQLEPLIQKLEPLAKIEENLSYSNEELRSEVISATVLARNAATVCSSSSSNKSLDAYLDCLNNIFHAGHYHLVVKESARFIEITGLSYEPRAFQHLLEKSIHCISHEQLLGLSTNDINCAYLVAKRLHIDPAVLSGVVSDEVKGLANIFDNDEAMTVLEVRNNAAIKRIDIIYKALDAFGYQYQLHLNIGPFSAGYHNETIDGLLFDALAMSGVSQQTTASKTTKLSKRLASFIEDDDNSHYRRRGRGAYQHYVYNVAELDGYPSNIRRLYEKISGAVSDNLLYTKEVLAKLHLEKIEPKHIVHCCSYSFAAYKDDVLTVCGRMQNSSDIFDLLDKFRPNTVTHIDEDSFHHTQYATDEYPYGRINAKEISIELHSISRWSKETLELVHSTFESLDLAQYSGSNPLSDLAKRLSPKFECCGALFNPEGTDYFEMT